MIHALTISALIAFVPPPGGSGGPPIIRSLPQVPPVSSCGNNYTFVNQFESGAQDASSGTVTATVSGIGAGDLLVAWVKSETASTLSSISDGTSSFTMATEKTHSNNDLHGRFGFLLSGNSGATTITATFSANATFRRMIVCQFTHTSAAQFDTEATGTGTSTTPATASLTTCSGAGLVVVGYSEYSSANASTLQVAGNTATGMPTTQPSYKTWTWRYVTSGTITGTGNCSLDVSREWVCNAVTFK